MTMPIKVVFSLSQNIIIVIEGTRTKEKRSTDNDKQTKITIHQKKNQAQNLGVFV